MKSEIFKLLQSGISSDKQLINAAKRLGFNVKVMWLKDYKKSMIGPIIINLGSSISGGTHWVATIGKHYFDSMGQMPPSYESLDEKNWSPLQIQKSSEGYCGAYCILFLYYALRDDIDGFYNLFNVLNII